MILPSESMRDMHVVELGTEEERDGLQRMVVRVGIEISELLALYGEIIGSSVLLPLLIGVHPRPEGAQFLLIDKFLVDRLRD